METLNSILTGINLLGLGFIGFFGLGIMIRTSELIEAKKDAIKMETRISSIKFTDQRHTNSNNEN